VRLLRTAGKAQPFFWEGGREDHKGGKKREKGWRFILDGKLPSFQKKGGKRGKDLGLLEKRSNTFHRLRGVPYPNRGEKKKKKKGKRR